MDSAYEIDRALAAHGLWKARLRKSIDSGESDLTPAFVREDNRCQFGKWLYGNIAPELKATNFYPAVVAAHAEFHKAAAEVLQLALSGKRQQAEAEMMTTSAFARASAALTARMTEWKQSLTDS